MKESTETTTDNKILIVDVEEQLSTLNIKEPEYVYDYAPMKFVEGPDPESNIKSALGIIVYEQLQPAIPRRILVEPVITKLLDLSFVPESIQRTQEGILWIKTNRKIDPLTKIDTDGSETTLTLDTFMYGLCVDPVAEQLYCAPDSNTSIRTVDRQSGETTEIFTTKDAPRCLNVTNDDHTFIVGPYGKPKVTLYDKKGTVLQTVTTVKAPGNIAVCRSTGKVAISCYSEGVMVMDYKDRLHYMYTYPTNGTKIRARDAEFDDAGHLLVADCQNSAVHIADAATGNTLKIITIDGKPVCLTKQNNGEIVLGIHMPEEILKIKYLG